MRAAGQIAMFEDDEDCRTYLRLLKSARDVSGLRILAWVLMADHIHLVIDTGDIAYPGTLLAGFMYGVDAPYGRYFNKKTGRSGTLFQGNCWSKPIVTEAQLIATVYYIHMNPQNACLADMRSYHWSSYQEYAGRHWVVDTSVVLDIFGSFEAFDAYAGSPGDVVCKRGKLFQQDDDVLVEAMSIAGVNTSAALRSLPKETRNDIVRKLHARGATNRKIARAFGIGSTTVFRIVKNGP